MNLSRSTYIFLILKGIRRNRQAWLHTYPIRHFSVFLNCDAEKRPRVTKDGLSISLRDLRVARSQSFHHLGIANHLARKFELTQSIPGDRSRQQAPPSSLGNFGKVQRRSSCASIASAPISSTGITFVNGLSPKIRTHRLCGLKLTLTEL